MTLYNMDGIDMSSLESITATAIGERLRSAREVAGLTQQDVAAGIDIARTTLVAIEKGQVRARIDKIKSLARLYGTSVNALLRQEAVHVDLVPQFRKSSDAADGAAAEAIAIMAGLARAEVELENLLGIKRVRNHPPERSILPGDVKAQAEQNALELRQHLGLGNSPITDIVTLLEMEMGVRVYLRPVDSSISGLFAYNEKLGACMLLNAKHRRTRRNLSAAHECGHLVSTRSSPEVLHENAIGSSREERYADAFGRMFLMPTRAVMQKFQEVTAGSGSLTRRHVIILAHYFCVSREAIVRRLEEAKLAKDGTWDWFKENGGITDVHEQQVLGDLSVAQAQDSYEARPTSLKLNLLAAEAYRQDILSEGQLTQLLGMERTEFRELLDDLELAGGEANAAPSIP